MRFVVALTLLCAALCAAPARAESLTKSILLPVYGSPALPRNAYLMTGEATNGVFGYVWQLSTKFPASFTLEPSGDSLGIEEYDIFFYGELSDTTPKGSFFECNDPGAVECPKHGQIPAGANYAVVTMSIGAAGNFRYYTS